MKKITLFLSAMSLIAISSCSSNDDNNTNPASNVLVKRVVATYPDGDGDYDVTYTYNGNKIVQGVYEDGYIEKYYYTGDQITKLENIFAGNVEDRELFTYNAQGKVIQYRDQDLQNDYEEVSTFVYNADNTITQTIAGGPIDDTSPLGETITLTMTNGEISQVIQSEGTVYNYTYDAKNSPFKNVTGFAEIAYLYSGDFEYQGRAKTISSIMDATHSQNYTVNTWQYNADNYPTNLSSTAIFAYEFPNQTETVTMQFFYE